MRAKHKFVFIVCISGYKWTALRDLKVKLQLSPEQGEASDARLLSDSPMKALGSRA